MTDETQKFTHIGIEKDTQLQISILSKVQQVRIYELVGDWTDKAWEQAKKDGLVTDAMLNAHWVSPTKRVTESELIKQDGKKLLKAVQAAKK